MHHPSVYGWIADWVIFCTNKSRERFQRMRTPALTLSESRRETSRLEAELKAYGMAHSLGGNEPVSPVWIALVTTPGAVVLTLIPNHSRRRVPLDLTSSAWRRE